MTSFSRRRLLGAAAAAAAAAAVYPTLLLASPERALRVGLVGCDSDGIALAAAALRCDPRVELVAIADENAALAERALAIFTHPLRGGGAHPQARVAADRLASGPLAARELCANAGIDAVLLAGALARRPAYLATAVAFGKPAYLLAPCATSSEGCRSIERSVNAAQTRGLVLGAGLPWRQEMPFTNATASVCAGAIGALHSVDAAWLGTTWRRDAASDIVLGDCIQSIDRANALLGTHPESATGTAFRSAGGIDYAIEYRYAGGSSFTLRTSRKAGTPLGCTERFTGQNGTIALDDAHLRSLRAQTASVAAFFEALRGRDGTVGETARRADVAALIASTRTAILGREAARAATMLNWEDVT